MCFHIRQSKLMIINSVYLEDSIHSDDKLKAESFFKAQLKERYLKPKRSEVECISRKIDYKDGMYIICLSMYLFADRLYILQVISENNKADDLTSNKFMKSFQLLEKQD